MARKRLYYIDNLRVLLISLVLLHHLATCYGGPGLWYYSEPNSNMVFTLLLTIFVATNQSFFMGMFFMISAFFLDKSLQNKSYGAIIKDKLRRLGIPLIAFPFILSAPTIYLIVRYDEGLHISLPEFYKTGDWFGFGPLWFVAALLIFTFAVLIWKKAGLGFGSGTASFKSSRILIAALLIGVLTYIIRLWFPVGTTIPPFGFQPAHFAQYIFLFVIGILASRNNWFDNLDYKQGRNWLFFALFLIATVFPTLFFVGGVIENGPDPFMGGAGWQSMTLSIWEQFTGFAIIAGLMGVFSKKYTTQGSWMKLASASAYTVYIIHPLILVGLAILIRDLPISSTFKFLLLAPVCLVLSFGISNWIRQIPGLQKIL